MAADLRERGLRNPRHTFGVTHGGRCLNPLFIAPLRPQETMIGLRMRARSWSNQMLRINATVPMEVEYAVWKVSVRQIGEFFVDMFTNDLEDIETVGSSAADQATGLNIAGLPISGQGHTSRTPLQVVDRTWAGEMGQFNADGAVVPTRAYAPYVSHAIWHIARMAYEMEIGAATPPPLSGDTVTNVSRNATNLYQSPPVVGRLVRGALSSMMGAGVVGTPDQVIATTTSLSDWAERLSVVDNPNRTYWDYLKAFGVHPSRIPGMPEPVLMQRRTLHPHGSPHVIWNPETQTAAPLPIPAPEINRYRRITFDTGATVNNGYAFVDSNGYQLFSATIDETRGKRLMVDEPSFLVGTLAWWPYDFDVQSACHLFDATYMINSGTWGDPSKGSPDERDFLVTRDIRSKATQPPTGDNLSVTGLPSHLNDDLQALPFAVNMLNLYLNGDSFSNNLPLFGHHRGVSGISTVANEIAGTSAPLTNEDFNIRLNTTGDVRFGVATDLVA